jgi:cytidylate kinase
MEDPEALGKLAEKVSLELNEDGSIFFEGRELGNLLRTAEVDQWVSPVSAFLEVRKAMVVLQRKMGEGKGLVAEGRDMATVVFPDAEKKFYLNAAPEERARRRYKQRRSMGLEGSYEEILAGVLERDRRDSSRAHSPLKVGEGAMVIDTTFMTEEEVLERILEEVGSE